MLLDRSKGYQKHNCKWGKVTRGPIPGSQRTGKPESLVKPVRLCFSINKDHFEFIKKQALAKSTDQGSIITVQQVIREALVKAFPCPSTHDMFGDIKKHNKPSQGVRFNMR